MKSLLLFLVCILLPYSGMSQSNKELPSLNSVRTPNSPAFSILGVQPTSVERPNTPADVAISMDNATEGFTTFPQNYAIELSPYWMSKAARSLTWRADTTRDVENSILRSLSLSFATTTKKMGTKDVTGLSYGFRFMVASGRLSTRTKQEIVSLETKLKKFSEDFSNSPEALQLQRDFQDKLRAASTQDEREELVKAYNEQRTQLNNRRLSEETESTTDKLQDFAPQRTGLVIEVAFASGFKSDTISSELQRNGYGFWLTPAYVQDDYSLVGVYRRLKDSLSNESTEYGFRLVYHKNRYSLSAEYLKGEYANKDIPNRERFSLLFEYVLTPDLWLTLSFGQDNKNLGSQTALFNSIGLRYNIHSDRFKLGSP